MWGGADTSSATSTDLCLSLVTSLVTSNQSPEVIFFILDKTEQEISLCNKNKYVYQQLFELSMKEV